MQSLHGDLTTWLMLVMSLLVVVFWYRHFFQTTPHSVVRVVFFPFSHISEILNIRQHPAIFPICFCYLYSLDCILAMLFIFSPYVGLMEWGIFLISEAFLISVYLFRLEKLRSVLICLTMIMLYAAWGAYSTAQARDDQVLNAFDFGESAYLLFASSYIIYRIIKEDRFEQDLVAFFTFFGVVTYAALQLIATIIMAFDFRENEDFSFYAVIITFTFWLLAVPWIRRLRYKLT